MLKNTFINPMSTPVIYTNLGTIPYAEAWDYQKKLHGQVQELKLVNNDDPVCVQAEQYQFLLLCEHPHVYTLGKSGSESNLLVDEDFLKSRGAAFFRIDRGGDITYHGPGQIVGYPIFDLEMLGIGVREYIHRMEESIIQVVADYGVQAGRLKGAAGVWIDPDKPEKARKICAIGVRVSRGVTMHGFAFNINTDLSFYQFINPCGLTGTGVTSLQKELGRTIGLEEVRHKIIQQFGSFYNIHFVEAD
jgi:lipoyl(octanoyl) transferase